MEASALTSVVRLRPYPPVIDSFALKTLWFSKMSSQEPDFQLLTWSLTTWTSSWRNLFASSTCRKSSASWFTNTSAHLQST